ncbi:MAG: 4Fe-4S binding protein [Deltaproteobacteria bacterium]|nr:4Fe-4S binding protein [Deltaproteobacteria bacterium]
MAEETQHTENTEAPQVDPDAYSYDYVLPESARGLQVLAASSPPEEDYKKIKLKKKPKSMAVVDYDSCVGCEYCVHVCPIPSCLSLVAPGDQNPQIGTQILVNEATCIACRNCENACPYDAIHVVKRELKDEYCFSVNLPEQFRNAKDQAVELKINS